MTQSTLSARTAASRLNLARTIVLPVAGFVILLFMTRWGIGTFPDSAHYFRGARQLLAGLRGGATTDDPGGVALTQLAPFYSMLLAVAGLVGLEPSEGARYLNAVLFALNIAAVGFILARITRHPAIPAVGGLLMLGAAPVLSVHVSAMSEPVFLLVSLLGFWWLGRYLETERRGFLIAAAASIGLSFLTRYAAASCVIAGTGALMLWGPKGLSRRLRDAVFFGIVGCLPMLTWMLRNMALANTATGRDFAVHLVGRSHAWQALYTASNWLHIPQSAPNVVRFLAWAIIGAGLLAVANRHLEERRQVPPVVRILALFIASYGAFLAVSLSFFDANTPLDDRILVPVFTAGLIVLLYALDVMWWPVRTLAVWNSAVTAGLVVFVALQVVRSAGIVAGSYQRGWGFTSLAWQHSATIQEVSKIPPQTVIYSNAPEIIYLNTGRVARPIPKRWLPMNLQPNPQFESELDGVRRQLGETDGIVVYFRGLTQAQRSLPTMEELTTRLSLRVLADEVDGEVLSVSAHLPE